MKLDKPVKRGYAAWQKAVLAGCITLAVTGTVALVLGIVKMSATIADYGGGTSAPLVVVFVLTLLSLWLFAGSGALLVYIARTAGEISELLRASMPPA